MRLLFLTGRLPYPPTRGDRLRAYHFLRVLSREHRITLLSFISEGSESGNVGALRPFCEDIQLVHRAPWQATAGVALNAWRPLPFQSLYYRSPIMREAVTRLLERERFDAVYAHLFRMAQFVTGRQRPYRILDLTDAISGEVERSLPFRDPLWRLIYRLELPRIRRYEREIVRHFDEAWVISEEELRALRDSGAAGEIYVVPNGVEAERYRPAVAWSPITPAAGLVTPEPALAFVGHMGVFHNVDAAEYLAHDILPGVRQHLPTTRLDLIGAEPALRVQELAALPGVRVLGHVSDLNAALNAATVFVAPLRFAAGIQNKVLEAMAAGLPVVTTSHVNQGIRAEVGRDLLVADETDALVEAVVQLLREPEARRELGRAGRAFVLAHYRWEDVLDRVSTIEGKVNVR
ncbi:glycosyltransferase [Promineifilum sp.]|uniref:glycosyltransferase n=1 Tax=Promineifilum sp. TaxID=2664178 RepID=UPI0035B2FA6D